MVFTGVCWKLFGTIFKNTLVHSDLKRHKINVVKRGRREREREGTFFLIQGTLLRSVTHYSLFTYYENTHTHLTPTE